MAAAKSKKTEASKNVSATESDVTRREEFSALVQMLASSSGGRFSRLLGLFAKLSQEPPQVLLFEGGSVDERLGAALYFAAALNCVNSRQRSEDTNTSSESIKQQDSKTARRHPCLSCPACRLFISGEHRDLFILDGRTESIKIDAVRALRSELGKEPHSAHKRVVILAEAHFLMEAAANSLLKSLEEPRPGTVFILCTPQRQRLLQTLVSRSWTLTLPWPHPHYDLAGLPSPFASFVGTDELQRHPTEEGLKIFEQALIKLISPESALSSAPSWMSLSGQKGTLDKHLAINFITHCRRALCAAMAFARALKEAARNGETLKSLGLQLRKLPPLAKMFAELAPETQWEFSALLDETNEALLQVINPSLALDRLAVRLFLLSRKFAHSTP